jgi:predicted dehydrogenase
MEQKLQFLLSGPGLIGRKHASLIDSRRDCELAAIVAPAHDRNIKFAAARSLPFFTTVEEALSSEKIDAAIISSPNVFHHDQALACLSLGIPALVEKPLTDDLEDAKKLVDAVHKSGVPILVGHHRSYSPLIKTALGFLRSHQFGRMVALQGSAMFYKPDQYFLDGPWRTKQGGGPILINLIHEIGLMREFAGEIAAVQAIAGSKIRNFEVEDTVSISLEFDSGALGSFLLSDAAASSKSWEMTSGENPAYPHFPNEACYHFAGTNGSLDFPNMAAKTYAIEAENSWWKPFKELKLEYQPLDPLEEQLDHFIDVIRNDAPPRVSAEDGYRNVQVVEAIQDAILTGNKVRVS